MRTFLQSVRLKGARMLSRPVSWRPDLKVWRNWMPSGVSWIRLVTGKVTRSKILQFVIFAKFAVATGRSTGLKGLVLYLKVCNTCLLQALPGGQLHFDSRKIGKVAVARSRDGIPRVIPAHARCLIRSGDRMTIQLWLTFFGIYRVIPCKGKPSFSTIVDGGRKLSDSFLRDWSGFIRNSFIPGIQLHTGETLLDAGTGILERPQPFMISSISADRLEDPVMVDRENQTRLFESGNRRVKAQMESDGFVPLARSLRGVPTSFAHRFSSAMNWVSGKWGQTLWDYLVLVPGGAGTTQSLFTKLEDTAAYYRRARAVTMESVPNAHGHGLDVNGRLALLQEAAGKVRVVALTDCWTQWALHPLHDWIFKILREIPQDGTFDQLLPVKSLLKKISPETIVYSYDLSAATDRIPIRIQQLLLASVFGEDFSIAWENLLVGRPYVIPKRVAMESGLASRFLRYAVGQPMGAYSSWAMLALTHHAMVQFCAHRAGYTEWFTLYAVLGDDIVIADGRVARKYRALCRCIGVTIGLNKSLVSNGKTLEFAKKLFFRGEDLSGLPIKFWVAAQSCSAIACALAAWQSEGTLSNFVRALGAGFRTATKVSCTRWAKLAPRVRALVVALTNPSIGNRFAFASWPEWLWSQSADISRPLNTDLLTAMSPFCTSVHAVIVDKALESLEDYQEDIFFTDKIEDPVTRVVDSKCNKAVAEATKSVESASKALRHLQSLNIRFNLVQVSAIITQVIRACDKAGLVPLPSTKGMVKKDIDPYRLRVSNVYKMFSSLRALGLPFDPIGKSLEDPYARLSKTAAVIPDVKPAKVQVEEDDDDDEGGWI